MPGVLYIPDAAFFAEIAELVCGFSIVEVCPFTFTSGGSLGGFMLAEFFFEDIIDYTIKQKCYKNMIFLIELMLSNYFWTCREMWLEALKIDIVYSCVFCECKSLFTLDFCISTYGIFGSNIGFLRLGIVFVLRGTQMYHAGIYLYYRLIPVIH